MGPAEILVGQNAEAKALHEQKVRQLQGGLGILPSPWWVEVACPLLREM